jgi:hypothetical protein
VTNLAGGQVDYSCDAAVSAQAGGQIQIAACHSFVFDAVATPFMGVRILNVAWANSLFALARKVQEQSEDVDEVQVEREPPSTASFCCDSASKFSAYCSLIDWVSHAVSPMKTRMPTMETTN